MQNKEKKLSIYVFIVIMANFFVLPKIGQQAFAQIVNNEGSCKVSILSMEARPTTIDTKTAVNFHAKVDRKGCAQNLDMLFEFYTVPDGYNRKTTTCVDKSPHKDIIEFDCPYNFSQYQFWNNFTLPGTLPYHLSVHSSAGHNYGNTLSWGKKFNVVKGTLGESFTFQVAPAKPSFGQNLRITYTDFPPGATGKIFVNGNNNFVNVFSGGNQIAITAQNGFVQTGPNQIKIELYDNSGKVIYSSLYGVSLTSSQSGTLWGCRAVDGVYACSNNQNDTNLKQACGSYFIQQPSDKCGCTDAEYTSGTKGKDCKANGGTGKVSDDGGGKTGGGEGGKKTDAGGGKIDTTIKEVLWNPLPTDSLTGTLLTIAKGFLAIVALWAVVFIIIGGFKLTMAQGNEEAYLAAKKTITWAILGVVVAVLSFSIIAIVQNLFQIKVPKPPGGKDNGAVINSGR